MKFSIDAIPCRHSLGFNASCTVKNSSGSEVFKMIQSFALGVPISVDKGNAIVKQRRWKYVVQAIKSEHTILECNEICELENFRIEIKGRGFSRRKPFRFKIHVTNSSILYFL